jgi:hypothetical protein
MKIHCIYKCCTAVDSVHGTVRPFSLDKKGVIRTCLPTVKKALEPLDCYYSIVGDAVSSDIIDLIVETLRPREVYNCETHQGYINNMLRASDFAMESKDNELVFFLEEDYCLDYENFAPRLLDFLELMKNLKLVLPYFIHPSEYPDQYTRSFARSYIIRGNLGYWREVSSTTETYICQAAFYKKKANFFRECHKNDQIDPRGSDGCTSSIFKKEALCWSPLPGLASHFAEGFFSPYVDWKRLLQV